jgi:hypothetical protein
MQWFKQKVLRPILDQLKQGSDPVKLAWSVSLAAAISIFPILGSTTALCALAGAALGLNHVAMQTVNYLMYAAQLALIPVLIRLGEKLTGAAPIAIDLVTMKDQFIQSPSAFFAQFGIAALHGILAWLVVVPVPTWVTARLLARRFKKIAKPQAMP